MLKMSVAMDCKAWRKFHAVESTAPKSFRLQMPAIQALDGASPESDSSQVATRNQAIRMDLHFMIFIIY